MWVLIYYIMATHTIASPPGVATHSQEFTSQRRCETAKEAMEKQTSNSFWKSGPSITIKGVCVEK